MLPQAATEFYGLQQRVNDAASQEVARIWRRMGDDLDASWKRLAAPTLNVLVEAQRQVAVAALDYVPTVLAETDTPDRPQGRVRLDSFVGMASDRRPLETLSYGGVVKAKQSVANGSDVSAGLDAGADWMDLMVKLQVADAARQVVGVMTAARPNLSGTVRVLNPPSCQRCAILAGRVYRWSTGFERHPRCDCVNLPVRQAAWAQAEGFLTDPMDAYRRGEIRDLTKAQRAAIDEGADISRVVNVKRGMSTTYVPAKAGLVKPGQPDILGFLATLPRAVGTRESRRALTPEAIYRQANGDRARAIELLRENAYIT